MSVTNLIRAKGGWFAEVDGTPWIRTDQGMVYTVDVESNWVRVTGTVRIKNEIDEAILSAGVSCKHGPGADIFFKGDGSRVSEVKSSAENILRVRLLKASFTI